MKTCPDCGCRVYKLGCVNCNENAYIEEQDLLNYLTDPALPPTGNAADSGISTTKLTGPDSLPALRPTPSTSAP